ncbi:MAG: GNAT family N-acetyltransferase [Chitinophagaceae bacterium]
MTKVKTYKTPQEYLNETEAVLDERELENNLILGICNGFPDKSKEMAHCRFINSFDNGRIKASSIMTIPKAIVSGYRANGSDIRKLADYYSTHQIDLVGVFGESLYADCFAGFYPKQTVGVKTMIVHQLREVNEIALTGGTFGIATNADIDILSEWTNNFYEESKLVPRKTSDEIASTVKSYLGNGDLFTWTDNGEIVSMAGIVRKTRHIGIVGFVYTPRDKRGHGYATSCVTKLSECILQTGFKSCGLFTDKSNPTSNKIYQRIGYEAISEFSDIEFG